MIRFLTFCTLVLTALFALTLTLARMPTAAVIPALGGCAASCWQGIQPGATSKEDALARLNAAYGFRPYNPQCFSTSSEPCDFYQWSPPDPTAISTHIQVRRGLVEIVAANSPGFTLGEALLTLDALHDDLAGINVASNIDKFYVWITFVDSSIGVSAQVPCPTSYVAFMQAPVENIVIQLPGEVRLPTTFAWLHRTFSDLCEG